MADALHAAASLSNMTTEQFSKVASAPSVVARAAGYGAVDTYAAIGALTRVGMPAPQAATQIRGLFTNLSFPLAQAQSKIDALSASAKVMNVVTDDGTL